MATRRGATLALLVCMLLLAALTSCAQPKKPVLLPDARQVLRVGYTPHGHVPLDPALAADIPSDDLQPVALLFSGLMTLDDHLNPTTLDARSVDISTDGLMYTFHLRDGLTFNDGTPITSGDFAYSLNRALDPCVRDQILGETNASSSTVVLYYLAALKDGAQFGSETCVDGKPATQSSAPAIQTLVGDSITTPDSRTLTLTLAQPDAALLAALAHPVASVVERSLVERYGAGWTAQVTDFGGQGASGMYMLTGVDTSDVAGDRLTLTRNPRYGGTKPRLREVDFLPWTRADNERAAYLRGESDVMANLSWSAYAPSSLAPDVHQTPAPAVYGLWVDAGAPPLDDIRVRQALSLALDRQTLASAVAANGYAVQPTIHLVPAGEPGYNPDLTGPLGSTSPTGDPAEARALWLSYVADRCHGDASGCPAIHYFSFQRPFAATAVSHTLLSMWQAALPGATITDEAPPGVLKLSSFCRLMPLSATEWRAYYPDPRDWLANNYLPDPLGIGQTTGCATDGNIIALLNRADMELDSATRISLYQQAEHLLVSDALLIPLLQGETAWEAKPYVRDYPTPRWLWTTPQDWAGITLAPH